MALKRKPHQSMLDPTNPGVRVDPSDLRRANIEYNRAQAQHMHAQGIQPGPLAGSGMQYEAPPLEQKPVVPLPPPSPMIEPKVAQQPEPPIPEVYRASKIGENQEEEVHPLLTQLEEDFGLKKISVKHVQLGGYTWTFRPMCFQDYEWMAARATETEARGTEPSMSVANISATLAAINNVPIYQMFSIEVMGRHIPDPYNPPPDIKYEAAQYLIEWLRNKVGMWEVIGKLDEQTDLIFEEERAAQYPLWQALASPYRRRIVELHQILTKSTGDQKEEDLSSGDDALQSQGSSPPMSEPSTFGTTNQQWSSTSTGMNGSNAINSMP
jgi:hypothetical protein